jgi:hypothetical protein
MSAFIKRYRARNGNTVIQVVVKDGRRVAKTIEPPQVSRKVYFSHLADAFRAVIRASVPKV